MVLSRQIQPAVPERYERIYAASRLDLRKRLSAAPQNLIKEAQLFRSINAVDGEGPPEQGLMTRVRFEHCELAGANGNVLLEAQRKQSVAGYDFTIVFDSRCGIDHLCLAEYRADPIWRPFFAAHRLKVLV